MAKGRKQSQGYQGRRVNTRAVNQRFLLVCEGEKTEKNYFEAFCLPTLTVKVIGLGRDPMSLVKKAKELQEEQPDEKKYNQVWCIFDRDNIPAEQFTDALHYAQRQNINIAYSNAAFELWFLLHFQECTAPAPAHTYPALLSKKLGKPYDKSDPTHYHTLRPHQAQAIRRAEKLLAQYNPPNPTEDNPSTTIHLLVQALNQYGRVQH
jgi:hypothetical protein